MAFTAFTFGDPTVSPAFISLVEAKLVGVTFGGTSVVLTPFAQNIAGGIVGTAYSEAFSVFGGTSPYVWSVLSGTLPASLTLNTSTGVISGTPSTAGTSSFTIQAVDSLGVIGSQAFQIIIATSGGGGGSVSNYGYVS